MSDDADVIIVGAGLAGLSCAATLASAGLRAIIVERDGRVGGRVRTDTVDGFALDHGFQVLLPAYPEAKRAFDYGSLGLGMFTRGALVALDGKLARVGDPWSNPMSALSLGWLRVFGVGDALKLAKLRARARSYAGSLGTSTRDELANRGFSSATIRRFFEPFYGGVLLDASLAAPAEMLYFTFKMFSEAGAAVPTGGMQRLGEQLAAGLDAETLRLNTPAARVGSGEVELADGGTLRARHVVLATDMTTAAKLTGGTVADHGWSATETLYFDAVTAPTQDAVLVLDGDGKGPLLHACVISNAAPGYAPSGRHLVSVTPRQIGLAEKDARAHLRRWFGAEVDQWQLIDRIVVSQGLPKGPFTPDTSLPTDAGVVVCGDHLATRSINGALASGRHAAESLLD